MLMNRTTPFMVPVDDANPAIIKNEALEAGKGAATISFSTISRLTSTLRLSRAGCLREAVKML